MKKAFGFYDFNANGSLAFIEFSSGMDLLFPEIWQELATVEFICGASVSY